MISRDTFYSVVLLLALAGSSLANISNRRRACNKAVKLGVTFYNAGELEVILKCCEKPFYENPADIDAIIDNAQSCVISNSMSKAIPALSLYNGFNRCTDLMALLDKLMQPFLNQTKPVIDLALNALNNCKKNNKKTGAAKEDACMNRVYGQCIAAVTKKFVNKVCKALVKKMTAKEWNCAKEYLPKVVNVKLYNCYNIEK